MCPILFNQRETAHMRILVKGEIEVGGEGGTPTPFPPFPSFLIPLLCLVECEVSPKSVFERQKGNLVKSKMAKMELRRIDLYHLLKLFLEDGKFMYIQR